MSATPRETYSHGHDESVLRSHRWRTAENSAGYLLPLLRPTDRLLDIGVGPGTITADLAGRLRPARWSASTTPRRPWPRPSGWPASAGLGNLTVTIGDVYALDLPDGEFDVVHAHQVLQHLGDPVAALREMARVLHRRTGSSPSATPTTRP